MRVAYSRSWAPDTSLTVFSFYFIYFIQSHCYKLQKVHNMYIIRSNNKRGKQHAKKEVSAIRLVNSVVNLRNGQVMFFEQFE